MVANICNYLNNYFYIYKETSTFQVVNADGKAKITGLKGIYYPNQYIKIISSNLKGIYQIIEIDEVNNIYIDVLPYDFIFNGVICALNIPQEIISLASKIEDYQAKNKPSAITSESLGNYSYSKAINKNGVVAGWEEVFYNDLKPYRRIYDGLRHVKEYGVM